MNDQQKDGAGFWSARSGDPCGTGSALGGVRCQRFPVVKTEHLVSILSTRSWNTRSQASETRGRSNIDRTSAPVSPEQQAVFYPDASLAAVIFGSPNSSLTYDSKPSYTVSIMEFKGNKVARETQYFADPSSPAPLHSALISLGRENGMDSIIWEVCPRIWGIVTAHSSDDRVDKEMDWKRLVQFALQGSSDLEQYAILLVRVSIGLHSSPSPGANKLFVAGGI